MTQQETSSARLKRSFSGATDVEFIVDDADTGLQWAHTLNGHGLEHSQCQKLIDDLNANKFGGHSDWRMPERMELLGIVDHSRREPAIDTTAFPDTEEDWYWTNTPVAGVSGAAWSVDFDYGDGDWDYHDLDGFVRAVRGPVVRAGQ